MRAASAVRSVANTSLLAFVTLLLLLFASGCATTTDTLSIVFGGQATQANALNKQAIETSDAGNREQALALYARALKLTPNNTTIRINRGNCYFEMGRYPEAYQEYATAARQKPDATVLCENGGHQTVQWTMSDAANRAGQALLARGDFANAISWFTTSIQASADNPSPYFNRALCRHRLNDLNAAQKDLNAYVNVNPRYEPFLLSDGFLLLLEGQRDATMKAEESAGLEAERRGDMPTAFRSYSRAYALSDPTFVGGAEAAARTRDALVRTYRHLTQAPPIPEAARRYQIQSEAFARDGNYVAAAEACRKATIAAPWFPTPYFNRALSLANINRYPDAIASMQEYVRLVPNDPSARRAQDKIYEWQARNSAPQNTTQVQLPPIVGSWRWFNGGVITFDAAGGICDQNSRAAGGWVYDSGRGVYVLNWYNGQFIDTLTMSADGQALRGHNQFGIAVSGSKL